MLVLLLRDTDNSCCDATWDRAYTIVRDHTDCWGLRHRRGEQGGSTTQTSVREDVAALSFGALANPGKHYLSPGSTQPFQKPPHQAHLGCRQVGGCQAIPSPTCKSTSKHPVPHGDGQGSPQVHPSPLPLSYVPSLYISFNNFGQLLVLLTSTFSARQAATASPSQVPNTAVIIQAGSLHN